MLLKTFMDIPYKNIKRHTAHTIVSWPNTKQWMIVHTSDLMMIIRQSSSWVIHRPWHRDLTIWAHFDGKIYKWKHTCYDGTLVERDQSCQFTLCCLVTPYIWHCRLKSSLSHPSIPGVTLCFCIGSYAAAATAADSCSRDNFRTTFWISFVFATIVDPHP